MLLYTKRAAPKAPKTRSRAGCIHCKEKKKKCNEKRPQCDRCIERGLQCDYEAVQPRKRRRISFAESALSKESQSPIFQNDSWRQGYDQLGCLESSNSEDIYKWEDGESYQYEASDLGLSEWEAPMEIEEGVEEIIRTEPYSQTPISGSLVRSRSQYPDLAMIAPSPAASPLLEFSAPAFMEFTEKRNRRALVDHFCNVLSHLIVFKEDTGNPFRQLVLPLSHASSLVMNAIFALSSAHMEYRGIENEEKSLDFHNRALQGLAQVLDKKGQANREEVLGAIMLLVYYEVLVRRGSSNIVNGHLKGAMAIMKSGPQISSPTSLFLERTFRFYDVIAALSLGTVPNSTTQPNTAPFPAPPSHDYSIPDSPFSAVDTLLGLSTDLWPIIHRLSHLLSFKDSLQAAIAAGQASKATVLRTELETNSQAIELALTKWTPTFTSPTSSPSKSDGDELPDSFTEELANEARMQSILNNAEAYRHSAFVYLYRTIRSLPRNHPQVQKHAHLSLFACANVVTNAEQCQDGPMSALLWPLFVAACEAVTDEDRELALIAFTGIERRQSMNNIVRAWEVVQELWRRVDLLEPEMEVDWRDVCAEMGFNIVFG